MRFMYLIRLGGRLLVGSTLILASGCSDSSSTVARAMNGICAEMEWEWCAPPLASPEAVTLLIDPGSLTATPKTLGETLDRVLVRAAWRPGSKIRALVLGSTADGDVQQLAAAESPILTTRTAQRHPNRERQRWITATREDFMNRLAGALTIRPTRRSMAAALAAAAVSGRGEGLPKQYILVFDGFDPALERLCQEHIASDLDSSALSWGRWLRPHMFDGVRLHFSFFDFPDQPHCPGTSLRGELARSLWGQACSRAGASQVLLEGGVTHFTDDAFAFAHDSGFRLVE